VEVNLAGAEGTSLKVVRLDRENDLVPVAAVCKDGKIVLDKPVGSAVFRITLK